MSILEVILVVTISVVAGIGLLSLRQAMHYDGDGDAFLRRGADVDAMAHQPLHPYAVRAKRRGWVMLAISAGLCAVLGLVHNL